MASANVIADKVCSELDITQLNRIVKSHLELYKPKSQVLNYKSFCKYQARVLSFSEQGPQLLGEDRRLSLQK